mgnify:CR=1 FL=1
MKAGVTNEAGDIVIPSRAMISAAILFLACTRLVPSAITPSLPAWPARAGEGVLAACAWAGT